MDLDNRHQPKMVKIEINAESTDLNNVWHELYRWLSGRYANVDFEYRKEKVTFYCHPRAIND